MFGFLFPKREAVTGLCYGYAESGKSHHLCVCVFTFDSRNRNRLSSVAKVAWEIADKSTKLHRFYQATSAKMTCSMWGSERISLPLRLTSNVQYFVEPMVAKSSLFPAGWNIHKGINHQFLPLEAIENKRGSRHGIRLAPFTEEILDRRQEQRIKELSAVGKPVIALVVQVNPGLNEIGDNDLPGLVLFSMDPRVSDQELSFVFQRVSLVRSSEPQSADDRLVQEMINDSHQLGKYGRRRLLPDSWTNKRAIYLADLFFHRKYLPMGVVTSRRVRCIAELGNDGAIEMLPQREQI